MRNQSHIHQRLKVSFWTIIFCFLLVSIRLFYWQVINANSSQTIIDQQSTNKITIRGKRGNIYTAEGTLLVGNQVAWDLYLNKKELEISLDELVNTITKSYDDLKKNEDIEISNYFSIEKDEFKNSLVQTVSREANWIKIFSEIPTEFKSAVLNQKIVGIHAFETETRYYPESSMAAHVTGFVGKDHEDKQVGYFGIEGALNKELASQTKTISYKKDAKGASFADQELDFSNLDGREITLTIRRDIQFIVEKALEEGIKKYDSQSGEIVVMEPSTGAILAVATWPHYDQANYSNFSTETFKNPTLSNLYEPGSTFKVITLATGIDMGLISPETECNKCAGPRTIGRYTINTWNKEFHPNITMIEALRKSDNTAMVFVSEMIGAKKFSEYIKNFGISESLNIDLQEDRDTPFPKNIGPIELATISFGQGISTNTMQMTRAISVIANNGMMMKPYIVSSVYDPQTEETIDYSPQELRRVIKPETAQTISKMMVHSAPNRNNWINKHFSVAGKSGTAQIPSETGGYKESGTIASYIGFAPADKPKFVMMVKLTEPQLDQWGATTTVPLWYEIADKIILLL